MMSRHFSNTSGFMLDTALIFSRFGQIDKYDYSR